MDGSASFLVFRSRRLNESIRFTYEEGRHHRQGDRERENKRTKSRRGIRGGRDKNPIVLGGGGRGIAGFFSRP